MTATAHRSVSGWPKSGMLLDLALTAFAIISTLALFPHGDVVGPSVQALDRVGFLVIGFSTLPVLVWRRFPLGVFLITAAATVVLAGLDYRFEFLPGPAIALYLLASSRDPKHPWVTGMSVAVVGMFIAYMTATMLIRGAFPGNELLHTGLAWALGWFAGERTRLRREQITELEERVHRAEQEKERERLLAVAEERARIARDLHDSAGHAINVIAVQAGAARLRNPEDPARSRRALETIEEVARQTADEIDHMVGGLREGGSASRSVEDPPGLASVDSLVARHIHLGHDVSMETSGVARPLGAAADQAAYRILQEALTNAMRHGAGDTHVEIVHDASHVQLTVTNPVRDETAQENGRGHGLIGMHERATLLGGSVHTEQSNGSFRLIARVPYRRQRT